MSDPQRRDPKNVADILSRTSIATTLFPSRNTHGYENCPNMTKKNKIRTVGNEVSLYTKQNHFPLLQFLRHNVYFNQAFRTYIGVQQHQNMLKL